MYLQYQFRLETTVILFYIYDVMTFIFVLVTNLSSPSAHNEAKAVDLMFYCQL